VPLLEPLGDQGILARFDDEATALRWSAAVRTLDAPWIVDVVQAYRTVAVFADISKVILNEAALFLAHIASDDTLTTPPGRLHRIPCCYELAPDLARVAEHVNRSPEEVIALHTATEYTIYAIGFCPGFPYLGYLPEALANVPRLATPRLRVEAGSVGLTGRQTGIYTEPRPGGWSLIGRTPLELVHVADGYFPLRTGDRVRFERIDEAEYQRRRGERLPG
jgi:inhibitor of KinA